MTYNRFFAFGCSSTRYFWPTWADIVGNSFGENEFYNFARPASGNVAIFNRVMEANTRFKITKDDLAMKTRQEELKEIFDRDTTRGFYFILVICLTIFVACGVLMYLEIKGIQFFG